MKKFVLLSQKVLVPYKALTKRKHHIELLTALLSVPVLITVIILNLKTLNASNKPVAKVESPVKEKIVYAQQPNTSGSKNTLSKNIPTDEIKPTLTTTNEPCTPELGPVSISSPADGETISENPASILVEYKTGEYCAAVWSYRINDGDWSGYDDKSIALYNLPQGKIHLELKVKSIVDGDEKTLTRNFIYKGETVSITPTLELQISNNSSASAN